MTRLAVAVLALVGLVALPVSAAPAGAAWVSIASGPAAATADTPAPASNPAAACDLLLDAAVTVTWTPSPTSWVTGYEVRWGTTAGGPYPNTSGVVTGSTYTTPALGLGTHYFVVYAAKESWRSTPTAEVSKTIVTLLLSLICV